MGWSCGISPTLASCLAPLLPGCVRTRGYDRSSRRSSESQNVSCHRIPPCFPIMHPISIYGQPTFNKRGTETQTSSSDKAWNVKFLLCVLPCSATFYCVLLGSALFTVLYSTLFALWLLCSTLLLCLYSTLLYSALLYTILYLFYFPVLCSTLL